MKTIRLNAGDISLEAELNDSETAQKIWKALPLEGTVNRWGDEIYFSIPVAVGQEDEAKAEVAVGEWGTGRSAMRSAFSGDPHLPA